MTGKRILVPLNLQQNSFDALEFVAGLSGEIPVCATLLYVVTLNISTPDRRLYDDLRRESEQRLQTLAGPFFGDRLHCTRVRVGRPSEEILAEAEETQCELIVMAGSTGQWRRWRLFPSTVERVVRDAPCLTLVLPRNWKLTPEHYRRAMRTSTATSWQAEVAY
jgi:nucleotide-binding universal stress UspA family protein